MNKYSKTYNVILDNMDLNQYRLRPISAIMYLQDTFARYTATKKMAAYDLFAANQYWIIAGINMEFTEELPFWSEEIKMEIWISEVSKLKIFTDFKLYHNNKVFSQGNALWFIIDKDTKRPIKADIVSERFELCNDYVLGEHKKFELPIQNNKINEISHQNNLSDLDFNKHVNNKSYINIAYMSMSDEYKKTHTLKQLGIKFNQETFLGDILKCSTYETDTPNKFSHIIEKDGKSVCDITTVWEEKTPKTSIVTYDLKVKSE